MSLSVSDRRLDGPADGTVSVVLPVVAVSFGTLGHRSTRHFIVSHVSSHRCGECR